MENPFRPPRSVRFWTRLGFWLFVAAMVSLILAFLLRG